MKYAWIKQHSDQWKLQSMCQVLQVSRSGYYAWINRDPSQRERDNYFLDHKITEIYQLHKGRYGSLLGDNYLFRLATTIFAGYTSKHNNPLD